LPCPRLYVGNPSSHPALLSIVGTYIGERTCAPEVTLDDARVGWSTVANAHLAIIIGERFAVLDFVAGEAWRSQTSSHYLLVLTHGC
jgi:hypothetical protein